MPWTNISKVESNNQQYAAKNVTSIAARILQMIGLQVQKSARLSLTTPGSHIENKTRKKV